MYIKKSLSALILSLFFLPGCAVFDFYNAREKVEIHENISYIPQSHNSRYLMDLFIPRGKKNFPTVIFVHGGYWTSQDKSYYRAITGLYSNIGIALAKKGIGAVITDYRINPEVKIDGELEDVLNSVKWTINNIAKYNGNPDKLVLSGHSAGGHMISLIGANPDLFKDAGIDGSKIKGYLPLSPILDLEKMKTDNDTEFNNKTTYPVFGKSAEILKKYSPVTYFRKGIPPFMIIYGENDYPYLKAQDKTAVEMLKELGNATESVEIPGYKHEDMVLNVGKSEDKISQIMADFVYKVTK
jgi:acetyl esterase/lipase